MLAQFMGTNDVGWVSPTAFPFEENFGKFYRKSKNRDFMQAVQAGIIELAKRKVKVDESFVFVFVFV